MEFALNETESNEPGPQRLNVVFAVAIICQVACWLLTTPGQVFEADQNLMSAARTVGIVFAQFFVIPLIVCFVVKIKPTELGLTFGDWKKGLTIVVLATPLVCGSLYFGCDDPEIKAYYPWPGSWLAHSLANMLMWFAIYFFYYLAFEFFYRGFVLKGLEPHVGLTAAVWIQVCMSVMMHFGKPTPELLASIPAGFLFAWLAIKTRSLIYVVLIHWAIGIANDLFAMHFKGWFE
jgi:membrane protease YdiL (CAAX protease family)